MINNQKRILYLPTAHNQAIYKEMTRTWIPIDADDDEGPGECSRFFSLVAAATKRKWSKSNLLEEMDDDLQQEEDS